MSRAREKFEAANRKLEVYMDEIDSQVSAMFDMVAKLEDMNNSIINLIQDIPRNLRTETEQVILRMMIGDAADD